MKNTDIKNKGIIGFFDILGYSSLLKNNSIVKASEIIINSFETTQQRVASQYTNMFKEKATPKFLDKIISDFIWLIFADSILLVLPCDEQEPYKKERWLTYFVYACLLYTDLFEQGLPIRGGITCGKYFIRNNCFAGKSIAVAHEISEKIELSAIVLERAAEEEIKMLNLFIEYASTKKLIIECIVPLKQQEERMFAVAPGNIVFEGTTLSILNVRQLVLESFWKHNKGTSEKVMKKVTNTELFLRYAIKNHT